MVSWLIVGMANLKGKDLGLCVCVCISRNPRRGREAAHFTCTMVNNSSLF